MPRLYWLLRGFGVHQRGISTCQVLMCELLKKMKLIFIFIFLVFTSKKLSEYGVNSPKDLSLCLERSLYGLKQAGRLWYHLLHATLTNIEYVQRITDTCLYFKSDSDGTARIGTYVDDLLVTGVSGQRVDDFFSQMTCLELKELGLAEKFLGMRVHYDSTSGYKIDQESTILELLSKHGIDKANSVRTPMGGDLLDGDQFGGGSLLPANGPGTPEHQPSRHFSRCSKVWFGLLAARDQTFI